MKTGRAGENQYSRLVRLKKKSGLAYEQPPPPKSWWWQPSGEPFGEDIRNLEKACPLHYWGGDKVGLKGAQQTLESLFGSWCRDVHGKKSDSGITQTEMLKMFMKLIINEKPHG